MSSRDETRSEVDWRDGQPFSSRYGDVYFSRDSGIAETRHVFLDGNRLAERWQSLEPGALFVIGETGFGTGLNFLCAWELFSRVAPRDARLAFVSAELHPLQPSDLRAALELWPELAPFAAPLRDTWSVLAPGWHRFAFCGGRVTLTLLVGDANTTLPDLDANVDAWFLDGFAPARNPDLWSPAVLRAVARASRAGATFATYTVSGTVRRTLEETGFAVEKGPGFGRKREMLRGALARAAPARPERPWLRRPAPHRGAREAVVVGGGLAGTAVARSLADRDWQVTLIERHERLAAEASGNAQGVLYTRLAPHDTALRRLVLSGYQYTLRRLPDWLGRESDDWERCGVIQLAFDAEEADRQACLAAEDQLDPIFRTVSAAEASALAGLPLASPGLAFGDGGWVHPPALCRALAAHPAIRVIAATEALSLARGETGGPWAVSGDRGVIATAPVVVVAGAADTNRFAQTRRLPLRVIRGQITAIPETAASAALRTVLCGEGYVAPARGGLHTLGATHRQADHDVSLRAAENAENLGMLAALAPSLYRAVGAEGLDPAALAGRAALRCSSPDYLPLVGPVADNAAFAVRYARLAHDARASVDAACPWLDGLCVSTAHGSRGLITAPLAGEIVAAHLEGEPMPVPASVMRALQPTRFLARALVRGRLSA